MSLELPDEGPLRQVVGWAVEHVVAEANFEGEDFILVGDHATLSALSPHDEHVPDKPFQWISAGSDQILAVRGPGRPARWTLGLGSAE